MRINGTKYPTLDKLPASAKPVSLFARENNMQIGHVYMKYRRFIDGYKNGTKGENPYYKIRCWNGTNYVIPD